MEPVPAEFVIALNPDESSSLPHLLRIPPASGPVVLKAEDSRRATARQARPSVRVPTARASGRELNVERKSVDDLVSTIVGGKLWILLAELAAFAATENGAGSSKVAAIVAEDRYSAVFKLRHVRRASIATQLAEAAVRYLSVPIVFAETRQLAQE